MNIFKDLLLNNKHISIAIFDTPLQVQVFCNKDKFQN
jgi:hypothetical protein